MADYAETKELILFHHLFSTLSLSEAAKKAGISVAYASKRLKSLREKLGDPLFVRSSARMFPTEKAKALYPAVHQFVGALSEIHNHVAGVMEPRALERHFRLLATDMASAWILQVAAKILEDQCPEASLEIRPLTENYLDDLASWADLAVFTPNNATLPSEFESVPLYEVDDVVLARAGHPLFEEKLSAAQLLAALPAYKKINFLFEFRSHHEEFSPYDQYGSDSHQNCALSTPYLWGIPMALLTSDYTALLPDIVAENFVRVFPGLAYRPLPHEEAGCAWATQLIWHKRNSQDPALTWFRSVLYEGLQKARTGLQDEKEVALA